METWAAVVGIGLVVGFLAGMFGKGGSAIATPLLHLAGFPAIVALASPLPAAIPSTLSASSAYRGTALVERRVVAWSLAFGFPATVVGALLTHWISGDLLVKATDLVIAGLGVRFLLRPGAPFGAAPTEPPSRARMAAVATVVGLGSGLLANSGGFLLVPLYLVVLRMPIKGAFATSLIVAAVLAVPGTVVHALLGHIDWTLVVVFGAASVPFSYLGARTAMRTNAVGLERIYGAALIALGVTFLFVT